jgi:hypothetical protein
VLSLLYSILRQELLYPRDIAACANTQCREFFEIERAGQRFCCDACSLHQRQREYWQNRGRKLRGKKAKEGERIASGLRTMNNDKGAVETLRFNRRTGRHPWLQATNIAMRHVDIGGQP